MNIYIIEDGVTSLLRLVCLEFTDPRTKNELEIIRNEIDPAGMVVKKH